MNPMTYLTTPDPLFGWLEWILFLPQIILLLAGAYFGIVHRDSLAIRQTLLQRLGYVLLALGGLGALLGVLKMSAVAPFDTRVWLLVIVLFELAAAAVVWAYIRKVYPQQRAAARGARPAVAAAPARPTAPRPPKPAPKPAVAKAADTAAAGEAAPKPEPRQLPPSAHRPGERHLTRRERKRRS